MDKVIIRESINLRILAIILLVIMGVLGGGFFGIYLKDFNDQMEKLEKLVEAGDWEGVENGLAEVREYKFFNKRVLILELNYLSAKNLEKSIKYELMEMVRIASYLKVNYDSYQEEAEEILGEVYYRLGSAYYEQALEYFERTVARLPAELRHDVRALNLYKKLYIVCEHLGKIDAALVYIDKVVGLESDNYEFQINLAKIHLYKKHYEEVVNVLEPVLFNNGKDLVAMQKSGMMLFALAKYLQLDIKADFYLEYVIAKHNRLMDENIAISSVDASRLGRDDVNSPIDANNISTRDNFIGENSLQVGKLKKYNRNLRRIFQDIEKTSFDDIISVFRSIDELKLGEGLYTTT